MSKIPLHINEPVEPITAYEAAWAKLTNLNSKAIHLEPRHATALVAEIKRLRKLLLDMGVALDGLAASSRQINEVNNRVLMDGFDEGWTDV